MKHTKFQKDFRDLQEEITDKENHVHNFPIGQRREQRNKINRLKGQAKAMDKKYWTELYRDEPELWFAFYKQGVVKPQNNEERKALEKFIAKDV